MIAVTHPGKMGDALYALPLARLLYGINGEKIDFYTSKYCAPITRLIEYQPYINKVIIPDNYEVERMDMGCQPWLVPVSGIYNQVIHAGFRGVPDQAIHQYIASQAGYNMPLGISYEFPKNTITYHDSYTTIYFNESSKLPKYVCIAPRGETSFKDTFNELIQALEARNIDAIIIGGAGDYTGYGTDATGLDPLDTLPWLAYSKGFVGLMSAMLVLANGFDIPRIAIHDGIHWDMRHVVYTDRNHYPINPSAKQLLKMLDI